MPRFGISRVCFAQNGSSRERTLDRTQQNIQLLTQSTSQNLWCLGADWETYFLCCKWNYWLDMELENLLNSKVWTFQTSTFYWHAAQQRLMRDMDRVLRRMRAKRLCAGYRPQRRESLHGACCDVADILTVIGTGSPGGLWWWWQLWQLLRRGPISIWHLGFLLLAGAAQTCQQPFHLRGD
jgi:hypothetical protein